MRSIGIILLTWFYCLAFGQKARLEGRIIDDESGKALSGASVFVDNVLRISEEDGSFSFELTPGTYTLNCSYLGYEMYTRELDLQVGNIKIDVKLKSTSTLLNTTTITGSRYERPIMEATVSLEVIRPYLIQNTNTIAIDQVLQKMPGVDIIGGQANIRGGSGFSYGAGTRVLLLLDDIPALQADAGFPNWNDFPVENIAQVEVLKGAASVLYGSSAMNGIINIRTGFPGDEPQTRISAFYTHFGAPRDPAKKWWDSSPFETSISAMHKRKIGKLDIVAAGLIRRNESFNKDVYDRYYRGSANLRYRFSGRLVAGVQVIVNPGNNADFFYWKDGNTGAHIGDSMSYSNSSRLRYSIDPHLTWFDPLGGRHKILARHYFVNNNNNENRSNRSTLNYIEYQYTKQIKPIGVDISTGIVSQTTGIKAELYGDTLYSSLNYAAYAQLEKRLWKKWILSAGARYEYNEMRSPESVLGFDIPNGKTIDRKPVFRLGTNYAFSPYSAMRASWGQGYRYPTVAERFINTPLGPVLILPNPNLLAETGWSAEIGYKQGLKIGQWMGFADVALFWQEYDNMMEFAFTFLPDIGFGFQSQNIGNTRISGIDLNVTGAGKIGSWEAAVLAGYTYVDPRYRTFTEVDSISSSAKRNILKYRFQHTAKIDLETGKNKWRVAASARYYSFMENIDAILEELVVPGLKEYREENNKGFTILDIRASYQITKKLKTSFLINNILNLEYSMRPGLLEAPRNFSLRLDYDM
jgi:outer membrane receptor protein involved in Fe transport